MSDPSIASMRDEMTQAAESIDPAMEIEFKSMFGGQCAYIKGRVFASLSDVGLAFKLPPDAQETLLHEDGAMRLQYEPSMPPSKQYIVVPKSIRGDSDKLADWMKQSLDHCMTLPAPKPKVKKKA